MRAFIFVVMGFVISSPSLATIEWSVLGQLPNGQIQTQLHQQLPEGWHTYWKNPGDSGMGARISPTKSSDWRGELEFPKPSVISTDSLITYGYINQVTYTLPITLTSPQAAIHATFNWLECLELCIPKEQTITLTIPKTMANIPKKRPPTMAVFAKKSWRHVTLSWPKPSTTAAFFPYHNDQFNIPKASISPKKIKLPTLDPNLTTVDGELFLDNQAPMVIHAPIQSSAISTLWMAIVGAFIGGLLLNIMPCVLPILGIKAMQLHQRPSNTSTTDALSYALGVGLSLLTLYIALLGLKWSGATLGWGFQLQSPIMIQSLIVLFTIMMAIHLNLIQFPLPKWAAHPRNNMVLSGILTTIIATPCTAPFLGSALSVALFQSPVVGLLIFTALAAGLALPMSLIIYNPNNRQWLPKSGAWNQRIKTGLTLGFIVTIGWLMWVLESQISQGALLAFFSSIMTLFAIGLVRSRAPKKIPILALIATIAIGLWPMWRQSPQHQWAPYSPALISSLEAKQAPYFIDVTAKWCITCQTNKLTVLNTPGAQTLLKEKNITLIRAGWTNHNADISALHATHGQASIPTYIYFNGRQHVIFSDVLTQKKLKEQLK